MNFLFYTYACAVQLYYNWRLLQRHIIKFCKKNEKNVKQFNFNEKKKKNYIRQLKVHALSNNIITIIIIFQAKCKKIYLLKKEAFIRVRRRPLSLHQSYAKGHT